MTLYTAAARLVTVAVVEALGSSHKKVYPGVPPETDTDTSPSACPQLEFTEDGLIEITVGSVGVNVSFIKQPLSSVIVTV